MTRANRHSSRSHVVFRMTLETRARCGADGAECVSQSDGAGAQNTPPQHDYEDVDAVGSSTKLGGEGEGGKGMSMGMARIDKRWARWCMFSRSCSSDAAACGRLSARSTIEVNSSWVSIVVAGSGS